jgi:hypothetical protein
MKCLRINHNFKDLITLIGLSSILKKHTTEKNTAEKNLFTIFLSKHCFFAENRDFRFIHFMYVLRFKNYTSYRELSYH